MKLTALIIVAFAVAFAALAPMKAYASTSHHNWFPTIQANGGEEGDVLDDVLEDLGEFLGGIV
jgi:hypothetical protein